MKKEKSVKMGKAIAQEVKEIMKFLVEKDHLNAEDAERVENLLLVIYNSTTEVFNLAPSIGKIHMEAKDFVSKNPSNNKRKEFVVRQKGEKNLTFWFVNGVKDEKAFCKRWEKHVQSISSVEDSSIGILYDSLNGGDLFYASYANGESVFIVAMDERDATNIMLYAINKNMIPAGEFEILECGGIQRACIYDNHGKELSGAVFEVGKAGGAPFNTRYSVLQFDDFRDGKHKER